MKRYQLQAKALLDYKVEFATGVLLAAVAYIGWGVMPLDMRAFIEVAVQMVGLLLFYGACGIGILLIVCVVAFEALDRIGRVRL